MENFEIRLAQPRIWPCTSNLPPAKGATCFLVMAVAFAIFSIYMCQLGNSSPLAIQPKFFTFALLGTIELVVLVAAGVFAFCHGIDPSWDEIPLPSEIIKQPGQHKKKFKEPGFFTDGFERKELAIGQLYQLVKEGDIEAFTEALSHPGYKGSKLSSSLRDTFIPIENDDPHTMLEYGQRHSLDYAILSLHPETPHRGEFLKVLFEKLEDSSLETNINYTVLTSDAELIELILSKLSLPYLEIFIINNLFNLGNPNDKDKDWYRKWLNHGPIWWTVFLKMWKQRPSLQQILPAQKLYLELVGSPRVKIDDLEQLAKTNEADLNNVQIDLGPDYLNTKGNILHAALLTQYPSPYLMQSLCHKYPGLLNQKTQGGFAATPLLIAILGKCVPLIKLCMSSINATFTPEEIAPIFSEAREGAQQLTPLMIASALGLKEIVRLLLENGAQDNILDDPHHPYTAKMAEWYLRRFENRQLLTLPPCRFKPHYLYDGIFPN